MCGIGGVIGENSVSKIVCAILGEIQDRGQDTAGIFSIGENGVLCKIKEEGLVSDIFGSNLENLVGSVAVGHNRYKTLGGCGVVNAQPFGAETRNDRFVLALSENGHIQNCAQLKEQLSSKGFWFGSSNDAEVIIKTLSYYLNKEGENNVPDCFFNAVGKTVDSLKGAYTCSMAIYDRKTKCSYLVAFTDTHNIRPGVWGVGKNSYAVASESIALEETGFSQIRDILPGECLVFSENEVYSKVVRVKQRKHCAFEFAYFSQALSVILGRDINDVRYNIGKALAKQHFDLADKCDGVVPVPFTPIPTAIGVADEWGVPLKYAIVKRRNNSQRTFIMPDPETRKREAESSFRVLRSAVRDKRLVVVEDSTVRGTNSSVYGKRLKNAGASWIALMSGFPRIINTCDKGIDMSTHKQLIAHGRNDEEIAKIIGFDEKRYISVENYLGVLSQHDTEHVEPLVKQGLFHPDVLKTILSPNDFCTSCFTGNDPTENDKGGLVD